MMLFSIIVPIYNVQEYLIRCLESICGQTYQDIEIVLVDDGSNDGCPRICDEYAKKDTRIKVIHKKNGGLSDARNKGLEVATGDYVIFVDSDDYIEADTCERFSHIAEKNYDILIGDATILGGSCNLLHFDSNSVMSGAMYYKESLKRRRMPVVAWINVYKRVFLTDNDLKFKCGILHEDVEFTPRVFLKAETVFYTKIIFYHYVIRDNSIMRQKDQRKNAKDLYNTCCEHETRFKKIKDKELGCLVLDSMVNSYLSMFQSARLYQYGKEYIHKGFCLRNSFSLRTKMKSMLFALSPRLYWRMNSWLKNRS